MDPLSITASVITVATLACQVCTRFGELRSLCRGLPGRLAAVNNEVADLEIVLYEIASLLEKRAALPDSKQSPLPHLLKQASTKLHELDVVVARLRASCRDGRHPLLAANMSRKEQGPLMSLQEDIRSIKCNLNILLGASNSQDMTQLRLEVESISILATQSSHEQLALHNNLLSNLTGIDDRIARVEDMLRHQTEQVRETQRTQFGPLASRLSPRRPSPAARRQLPAGTQHSDGFSIRVVPFATTCRTGCACVCHSQQKAASPRMLNRVLGQLFIGYTGLPYLSPKCDNHVCAKSRASKVSIEYWFPWSMLSSTIIRLQAGYQASTGTLFQLQTFRSVPDGAECVNFALSGNIDGLKYLFSKGLASPRDVSPTRGYTLLRWALYGKQYATCEFLIHAGADPDYKPISANDNSPRIKACHFLLEGGLPDSGVEALRLITRGGHYDDFIDEAGFTQIHSIVLGLSFKSLEEELALHPEDINAQDYMGRTPLAWAAAKGDTRAVVALLSHGADPNIMDVQISGPVSNAAAQGHAACVRLLLEAGAYPDAPLSPGTKKGSPLNVAARRSNDISLVKSLLDFGADVESSGVDGMTSLIHAARTDNASFAMLLLEYGADINASSVAGSTPLTTAITHNNHSVLRLILDRWHEYTDCPRLKGPHLLHTTALYADIETLQILASTDHLRDCQDKSYGVGDFSDRLRQRVDYTEKLSFAFEELLEVINSAPDARKSPDHLAEVGYSHPVLTCMGSDISFVRNKEPNRSQQSNFFSCPDSSKVEEDSASSDDAYYEAAEKIQ
ncbi:hypothetical protein BDV96DRAFT_590919 [Lophiotrema nucula]|uniref:Uncharacterized protein n=1 Tax=Lophiotrema nucula TaxID=690887 RepID=A0A6A5YGN3_9PLEO|nr:hypothetical protein BDV96DRAFT_590919 [Lophiotrema nucula]